MIITHLSCVHLGIIDFQLTLDKSVITIHIVVQYNLDIVNPRLSVKFDLV